MSFTLDLLISRESNCLVRLVVCDAPKRALVQGLRKHNANFGCGYCTKEAKRIKETEGRGAGKASWTSETFGGTLRTKERLLELGQQHEVHGIETEGVVGVTPLFRIPGFDPIRQVPPEIMHLGCLGVAKKMMLLLLDRKTRTARVKPLPAHLIEQMNESLASIAVPSEVTTVESDSLFSQMCNCMTFV
jgi:hypothetical protein